MRTLAEAQLEQLVPILESLRDQACSAEGFDRLLAAWRYESAEAATRVLEGVLADRARPDTPTRGEGGSTRR
jgi:hypothetical protein